MPIVERKRIPAEAHEGIAFKEHYTGDEGHLQARLRTRLRGYRIDPPSFPAVLPTLRTDLKATRELVTKYGHHMQTIWSMLIRGAAEQLKDRGDPVTREGVGTEFKTVSLAKKLVLQPNNNARRCLRKLAR